MSRTHPWPTDRWALEAECPRCHMPRGEWCKSKTGRWASYLHAARTWPAQEAWSSGHEEGRKIGGRVVLHRAARKLLETPNATITYHQAAEWLNKLADTQ